MAGVSQASRATTGAMTVEDVGKLFGLIFSSDDAGVAVVTSGGGEVNVRLVSTGQSAVASFGPDGIEYTDGLDIDTLSGTNATVMALFKWRPS